MKIIRHNKKTQTQRTRTTAFIDGGNIFGKAKDKKWGSRPAAPILLPMLLRVELMHVCEFYLDGA